MNRSDMMPIEHDQMWQPSSDRRSVRTTPKALRAAFDREFWQRLASSVDLERDAWSTSRSR